jgi:hypothetical protein
VVNDGSIAGTGGTGGAGVRLYAGGSVANAASASITGGANGVHVGGGVGTLVNDASIAGSDNGALLDSGGSVINAASASITGGSDGVDLSAGGTLTNAGTIIGSGGTAAYFGGSGSNLLVLDPSYGLSGLAVGGISASNTLELASAASAGTIANLGAEFINFGSIVVDPGADWTIDGGGSDPSGSVTVENDATLFIVNAPTLDGGSVYMESGSVVNVSGASSVTFDYADAATLALDNPATFTGTIGGFGFGDAIELTGETITAGSIIGTTLTLDLAGGGTQTLNVAPGESGEKFATTPSGGLEVACFCAGTRLMTVSGEVAVEALAPGDLVVTMSGRRRPVRWIGQRRIEVARHPRPQEVHPVRVHAHAFGADMPHRDLLLSPDHAVFVGGVLIPVRYLCNGATVLQEAVAAVSYFHVELESHDILLAEGLPAESYLDTGNRGAFANGGGAVLAHADFAPRIWETQSCAPLVLSGAALAPAKTRLLVRALALGFALTTDPDLRLIVDGQTVRPDIEGSTWRFALPDGAREIRLASRSVVPAFVSAESADHRRIGVAVAGLRVDGEEVQAGDPRRASGWHEAEEDWQWTNGDAGLACAGARRVEVTLVLFQPYWDTRVLPRAEVTIATR